MQSDNEYYTLPRGVYDALKNVVDNYNGNKKEKGYVIAKNAVNHKKLSFRNCKKIKHEYETSGGTTKTLLGGDKVYQWIISILNQKSRTDKFRRKNKERAGLDNAHRKSHTKNPSAKPSFINSSYKIIINEKVIREFKLTNKIGAGSEGEVFETGKYVVKRFYDVNPVRRDAIMSRIYIHQSIKDPHLIEIIDFKENKDTVEVFYEKLVPIENNEAKEFLDDLYYDYYIESRKWNIDEAFTMINLKRDIFDAHISENMKGIIKVHNKLDSRFKSSKLGTLDAFFPITGDNVMQDSSGTWKLIDF